MGKYQKNNLNEQQRNIKGNEKSRSKYPVNELLDTSNDCKFTKALRLWGIPPEILLLCKSKDTREFNWPIECGSCPDMLFEPRFK